MRISVRCSYCSMAGIKLVLRRVKQASSWSTQCGSLTTCTTCYDAMMYLLMVSVPYFLQLTNLEKYYNKIG
jgi:hypothetical protein